MKSWIERQRNIIDFTFSSLLRRRRKNAALITAYTLVVFRLASVLFFTQSLKREATALLEEAPEMIVQKVVAGRHELVPTSYVDAIRGIPGVIAIMERYWGYYYDPISGANYTLAVADDPRLGPGRIVIGEGVSRARLAFEGDSTHLRA